MVFYMFVLMNDVLSSQCYVTSGYSKYPTCDSTVDPLLCTSFINTYQTYML